MECVAVVSCETERERIVSEPMFFLGFLSLNSPLLARFATSHVIDI